MEALTYDKTTALRWGVWDAIDQYRNPTNVNRPNVVRITDQELLNAVRAGPFSAEIMEQFLKEYEVFRYPLNVLEGRDVRLRDIANIIDDKYSPKEGRNATEELPVLWWGAVENVRSRLAGEFTGKQYHMRSMCMKLLWFYEPSKATMWDRHVVAGLNIWQKLNLKTGITRPQQASEFLDAFGLTFSECAEYIQQLLATVRKSETGMDYPYPRRVLDKALWFIGASASEQAALLDRCRADLERWSWFEANG